MLKKLRIKFVAMNMATIAVVLTIVFTAICVINYQQNLTRVYSVLDGSLNGIAHGDGNKQATLDGTPQLDKQFNEGAPPEIGGKRDNSDPFTPVAVYSVNADGSLSAAPSARTTASISDETLEQAAAALSDKPDGSGALDAQGLYYAKRQINGSTYLAFTDISATSDWQSLAVTLAAVGLVALVVFFVISVFFSRWALRPVENAWVQQRRFVADASHELKTPLTVILANASILLEHPERSLASQSQWVESTQTEAERMQQLVNDLLLLARLDEGEIEPLRDTVELGDLIEGDLLQFESVAFERNVILHSNIDNEVTLAGDASRLHRLATTLIDNACKYANSGGEVTVELQKTGRAITFAVHNTGPAIAAEDLPHVFDRFYRADKARTRDDNGYGLGLAIARAVAEEHGGTLTVLSSESEGTTFTATFPLENA